MEVEQFDPLKESQVRARADVGRKVYEQFMERDAQPDLTPEEHTQGYQDFADYLEVTPYQDNNGSFHNPVTGEFISKKETEEYYSYGDNPNASPLYEDMSVIELLKLSAEAEARGDKGVRIEVDDVMFDKIESHTKKYADDYVESDGTLRDKSEADLMYERYDKLHKKYLDEAKARVDDDKVNNGLNPDGWHDKITNEQAQHMDKEWVKQTGQQALPPINLETEKARAEMAKAEQQKVEPDEQSEGTVNGMFALPAADIASTPNIDDIDGDFAWDVDQNQEEEDLLHTLENELDKVMLNFMTMAAYREFRELTDEQELDQQTRRSTIIALNDRINLLEGLNDEEASHQIERMVAFLKEIDPELPEHFDSPDAIIVDDDSTYSGPIIVDDSDGLDAHLPGSDTIEQDAVVPTEKKKGFKNKLLGAVAVLAVAAAGVVGYNALNSDDESSSDNGDATEQEAPDSTSPVDIVDAEEDVFGDEETGDEEAEAPDSTSPVDIVDTEDDVLGDEETSDEEVTEETSETSGADDEETETNSEEPNAATVDTEDTADTAESDEEQIIERQAEAIIEANDGLSDLFASLDASEIEVAGDVMPWTNFNNAGASNALQASVQGLQAYNLAYGHHFELGDGGMFWEDDRIISPQQLTEYNELMKQLAITAEAN